MHTSAMDPPPLPECYLTADLPGTLGRIKQRPEDFLVEEQPLYEPCGEGEHLYLFVEKRNQTTTDVARRIARMFNVPRGHVGYAGLKDKHAVTRQLFSVHQGDEQRRQKGIERFEFTPFKLLWAAPHTNKLRRGHLAGNRFVIRIRKVEAAAVLPARRVLERLECQGVPNFLGQQRFGARWNNHLIGRALLRRQWRQVLDLMLGRPREDDSPGNRQARELYEAGDYQGALDNWLAVLRQDRQALDALRQGRSEQEAVEAVDDHQLEFFISALQSAVFNRVLARRLEAGTFDRLLPGDLAAPENSHGVFRVDAALAEQENAPTGRIPRLEVSPTGPMWGPNMMRPEGEVLELERAALGEFGLAENEFEQVEHVGMTGSRRALRIRLRDPDISAGGDEHGPYIRLAFELPRGSFATIVLREIMKGETGPEPGEGHQQVPEDEGGRQSMPDAPRADLDEDETD